MPPTQTIDVIGDTHCDYRTLAAWAASYREDIGNVLIHVGDVGIGFPGWEKGLDLLEQACEATGRTILCIRGNHDDPDKFDGSGNRVKLMPDWTVIDTGDDRILLAGGAISPDRVWRKENDLWWEGERFSTAGERAYEAANMGITRIITHNGLRKWVGHHAHARSRWMQGFREQGDWNLFTDLDAEQAELENLLTVVRAANACKQLQLRSWHFGHWHRCMSYHERGTQFRCLDKNEITALNYTPNYEKAPVSLPDLGTSRDNALLV